MRRRQFVAGAAGLVAAYLLGDVAQAGAAERGAFAARSLPAVLRALGLPEPEPSRLIRIGAPDIAENGANVPVEIVAELPGLTRLLLIGERNLVPLLLDARFTPRLEPRLEARIKLAEDSDLVVLAEAAGRKA